MHRSSSPRAMLAALVLGAGALFAAVPAPAAALPFAPASLRLAGPAACTMRSQFTVAKTIGGATNSDIFQVTQLDAGAFRGSSANGAMQATGYLRGNTFQLTAQGSNGYNYSLDGTLDERTGTISGTGSDNQSHTFTFTIGDGVTCDGTTAANPNHPADDAHHPATCTPTQYHPCPAGTTGSTATTTTNGKGCPAAPAVANAYMKSLPAHGSKHRMNHGGVISRVARHMGRRNSFEGSMPCDTDYAAKVRSYVDRLHNNR